MSENTEVKFVAVTSTTATTTNTMALIGFILSLFGVMTFVTAIPGVILGHIGLKQIRGTGESGHGLAVAAIAVGYAVIGIGLMLTVLLIAAVLLPIFLIGITMYAGSF